MHTVSPSSESPAFGLTGRDFMASYFGIGKAVARKVLRSDEHSYTGTQVAVFGCQGTSQTMSEARQRMWLFKVGRNKANALH